MFFSCEKHLYTWSCRSVCCSVGLSVGPTQVSMCSKSNKTVINVKMSTILPIYSLSVSVQSQSHQLLVLPANFSQYAAARLQQGARSNSRTSFSLAIPGGSCSQLPQFLKLCWERSLCKFVYFQLEGNGVLIVSQSVSNFN